MVMIVLVHGFHQARAPKMKHFLIELVSKLPTLLPLCIQHGYHSSKCGFQYFEVWISSIERLLPIVLHIHVCNVNYYIA